MLDNQDVKYVMVTAPAAIIDNASATTTEIDTKGYNECTIVCIIGATDVAMSALAVTESDTSGSGHANVTGLVWGTSTNIDGSTSALPVAGDDNTFQVAQIDLKGRKRYLDVTATIGNGTAGTFFTCIAILSRAEESPNTATDAGCDEILRV